VYLAVLAPVSAIQVATVAGLPGLFALTQGLRRLKQIGGERVRVPDIEWTVS